MKKLLSIILGIFFLSMGTAYALPIINGPQGGTGIGSATAGDVGDCLVVLDDSPFTYELGSCGSGSISGGTAGTIAAWTSSSALTGTSTINANAFNATSSTSTFKGIDTDNARISNLTSALLIVNGSGYIGEAVADTDYQVALTFGDGLTRTANDVDCDTASGSVFGCLSSADWTTFNNKISASTTAISLLNALFVGRTSTTTIRGDTTASSTFSYGLALNGGSISSPSWAVASCDVKADSSTGHLYCGTDATGGGGEVNWTYNYAGLTRVTTTTSQVLIGASATTTNSLLEINSSAITSLFSVASGTEKYFTVVGTSTNPHGSVIIGTSTQYGFTDGLDPLFVDGPISTGDWVYSECNALISNTTNSTSGTTACDEDFVYYEDSGGGGLLDTIAASSSNPYLRLRVQLGQTANNGAGLFVFPSNSGGTPVGGWIGLATNTPVMEAKLQTTLNATGTNYYFGLTNLTINGSTYEVAPTAGCYWTASTTQANWIAICSTTASNMVLIDSGIASSSVVRLYLSATDKKMIFAIESKTQKKTAYITDTSFFPPDGVVGLYPGLHVGVVTPAAVGTIRGFYINYVKVWIRLNPFFINLP